MLEKMEEKKSPCDRIQNLVCDCRSLHCTNLYMTASSFAPLVIAVRSILVLKTEGSFFISASKSLKTKMPRFDRPNIHHPSFVKYSTNSTFPAKLINAIRAFMNANSSVLLYYRLLSHRTNQNI